ncbi:hypothetical protein EJB05_30472 [Eragrostis curvula]|uniref:Cullin family profile domain-containing protein n=1 Tax=Eragrostis curvula TaxID=38414 RepID=A0A5J9UCC0_9POAL|nr:hypothetical protein EJB05_30472 [Eragrostis curvula]
MATKQASTAGSGDADAAGQQQQRRKVIELEEGWKEMVVGCKKLERILAAEEGVGFSSVEYMHLYTTIYNMCTEKAPNNYSEQLYDRYPEVLEDYISKTVLPSIKEKHGEFLIRELDQRWKDHKIMVRWLSRFFHYLERVFIPRRRLPSLKETGWNCFRDLVFNAHKTTVTTIVTGMVDEEREGQIIDRTLLKNVLDIYVELGNDMKLYQEDFVVAFLKGTADYYSKKSQAWILEDTCPEYMMKAEEYLQKEKERVKHYLHSSTEEKLMEVAQRELLAKHTDQILKKLLFDDKVEDLSRMFRLFSRIDGLAPVSKVFKEHVNEQGMSLVQQAIDAAISKKSEKKDVVSMLELDFVRKILELHDKNYAYVTGCFQNHKEFHKALREAFEVVCSKDVAGCTSAELFASYCDSILRKGGIVKLSDEAIEENLDTVVKLITYIRDKDLFFEFHRLVKKLGRRLLFEKVGNEEHERSMLSKLKQNFGEQFTSKMEGMLTDITETKGEQCKYEAYIEAHLGSNPWVDLSVTVLRTGHWPTYRTCEINLPYEMAALLLLFNDSERLSYSEIVTQLKLTDDDTVRVLHSLSCAKYKILNKEPSNRTISPNDVFEFNSKFTDRMCRIKVQLPPSDEKKKVIDDVNTDRKFAIDASLVRIMKSRKISTHHNLVAECVEQLSRMFRPDVKMIKRRIEDLITREYLERDKDAVNSYRYLA